MIKKLLLAHLLLAFIIAGSRVFLGFFPWHIVDAVGVATGLGAKIGCSARFISGFEPDTIINDLASYSPVNRFLDLAIDQSASRVSATLFGLARRSATYRPGLGCTLDIGDTSSLDQIKLTPIPTQAMPWPAGNQVNTIDITRQQQLDEQLRRDNADGLQTRALVLVENGVITAESYAEAIDVDTPLLGWSMGKSLTAVMIGRMDFLGKQDNGGAALFPQWREDSRRNIALLHLMQMSSGLRFDETYAPGSDSTRMLFSSASASDVALDSPANHPPGQRFAYSSGTTNILTPWMHQTLGGTQASVDFLYQEVFAPLGMRNTIFEPDPSGVFVGSSYIYASARDWARLGWLMVNNGRINGQQLLSPDWVKRAASPNQSSNDPRYGYQFWLNGGGEKLRWPELPADAFFMTGNRKQYVMMLPSKNVVIVRLGWTRGHYPMAENFAALLR